MTMRKHLLGTLLVDFLFLKQSSQSLYNLLVSLDSVMSLLKQNSRTFVFPKIAVHSMSMIKTSPMDLHNFSSNSILIALKRPTVLICSET
eukprot:UN01153